MPGLGPQPNRTPAPRLFHPVEAFSVDADNIVSAGRPGWAWLTCICSLTKFRIISSYASLVLTMPLGVFSFDYARASCASFGFSCSRQQNFGILSFSRCSGHQKMRFPLFLILPVRQRNKSIHIWLKILFAAWCHEPFLRRCCFKLPWQCCTACYYCCPRQP